MLTKEQIEEFNRLPLSNSERKLSLIARLLMYHYSDWCASKSVIWESWMSDPYTPAAVHSLVYKLTNNHEWASMIVHKMCLEWEAIHDDPSS